MFTNIWWLWDFPHIIALSSEIKKWSFIKRIFYETPLLIKRNKENNIFVFLDVCPHKRAPLNIKNNQIYCEYHGWSFFENWEIQNIPSSPWLESKIKCSLHKIQSKEKYGFIWIFPNNIWEIPKIDDIFDKKWKHIYKEKSFNTRDDLLIENFMDSTHTPIVHNWIVRADKTKTKQSIKIEKINNSIVATFSETKESVGFWINNFLKNKLQISHTDTFLPPNFVKVNYKINKIDRFQAFIACTPENSENTHWFFIISYNFWKILNFFLTLIIPIISKIVLIQDYNITKKQFENIKKFETIKENHIDYDSLHTKVKTFKNKIKNREIPPQINKQDINIYI